MLVEQRLTANETVELEVGLLKFSELANLLNWFPEGSICENEFREFIHENIGQQPHIVMTNSPEEGKSFDWSPDLRFGTLVYELPSTTTKWYVFTQGDSDWLAHTDGVTQIHANCVGKNWVVTICVPRLFDEFDRPAGPALTPLFTRLQNIAGPRMQIDLV
jgi:hypothetical protein